MQLEHLNVGAICSLTSCFGLGLLSNAKFVCLEIDIACVDLRNKGRLLNCKERLPEFCVILVEFCENPVRSLWAFGAPDICFEELSEFSVDL